MKSAWRKLLPSDDASHFYTTEAIYYETDSTGSVTYHNDIFALIGIHVIHKTRNFPDFVFATFEQVDVENADMYYTTLAGPTGSTEQLPAVPIVHQTGQTNRTENHPVPPTLDAVTQQVHASSPPSTRTSSGSTTA